MSFLRIAGQLNCHLSNALYIYNRFVSSCSTEKKERTGCSIKMSKRGVMIVCRPANKRRFGTFKRLINEIVKNIHQSDVCRTGIKYIIRKIVQK